MNEVPQTVNFELRLKYMHVDRIGTGLPTVTYHEFDDLCEMISFAHKEKRRRAYRDRATDADYEVKLTEHGKEVCEADPRRAASHEEMLGKYHNIF